MPFDAGSIEASATVDLTPFQRGLEQAKRKAKDFEKAPIQARLEVDTKAATTKMDEWRKAQSGKSISIGVDIDAKKATAEVAALQKKLAATKAGTLTVNVSLDTRRATQQLATWRARNRAPLNIPLGLDTKLAAAELRAWRNAQSGETVHVDVDTSTAGADAKLTEFRTRESAKSIKQRVDVDTNSLALAKTKIEGFDKSLGQVGSTAASVAPSLRGLAFASIGYAAASAVPAVGALGEALINLSQGVFLLPGGISVLGASAGTLMLGMNGLTSAFKAASAASDTAGKSAKAQATAQAQLDAALAKLAPSARDSVKAVLGLKDAFDQMKLRVQQSLFAGLASEIKSLGGTYLPVLSGGMSQVASAFNGAIKQVAGFLKQSQTVKDIGMLFSDTAQIVRNLSKAIKPVLDGLRDMGTVGVSYLRDVTTGAGGAAQKFADWARNMRQTGQFKHDLQEMGSTLHNLVSTVVNVGGAFGALFHAMNATGSGTLNLLREVTGEFNQWAKSMTGQATLIGFFTRLKEITDSLKPAVHAVFDALGQAFQILAPVLPGVAQSFADIVKSLAPMIPMAARLARDILPPLFKVLSDMGPVLIPLVASFVALRGAVKGLLGMASLVGTVTKLAGAFRALAGAVAAVKTAGLIGGLKSLGGVGKTAAAAAGEAGAAGALTKLGGAAAGVVGSVGGVTAAGASLATILGVAGVAGAALAAAGGIAYLAVGAVKAAQNNDHLDSTMVSTADNIAHNSKNLGEYRAEMNKWLAKQKDATTANTVYGSSWSDMATAGKHFADTGKEAKKVVDLQNGALTTIASTLGVSLPQAFAISKAANIDLTKGFRGSTPEVKHNQDVLNGLKKAGVGLDAKFKDLNQDVQTWTDKTSTASQKASALANIFDTKTTPGTKKAGDATASFYQNMDTLGDSMAAAKGKALDAAGGFDLTSEKGRTLRTAMEQAQTSMFNYATQAHAAGVPTATINKNLTDMRNRLIDTITPFVGSRQAAENLANQLGLIPTKISIAVGVKGGAQAEGAFDVLKGKIDKVTGPRTLIVHGLTNDAMQKLIALGFKVERLPNGQFKVTANTDAAGQALAGMLGYINTRTGTIRISGDITPGQQKLLALIDQGNGSVAWAKLDADSASGKKQLADLIAKIYAAHGAVTIGGDRIPANLTTEQLVAWINNHGPGTLKIIADDRSARATADDTVKYIDGLTGVIKMTLAPPDTHRLTHVYAAGPQGYSGRFADGGYVSPAGRIVHAARGLVLPGYAPGKDVVPALLSPGESVLTPELTQAVGPRNIMAANAAATLSRSVSNLAGGGVPAPLTHNGSPRTRYFEDFSANYADGSSWNPDTGSFDSPAVTASRQASAASYVAGLGQAFNIPPIIATVKATTFASGGVAGSNLPAGVNASSVSSPNVSTPTGTEQLSAQGLKQTTTQTQALTKALQGLKEDWAKTAGVVTSTVVPAFTQTSAVVAAQAVGAVGGLAAYVPVLGTQFAALAGTTRLTWGQVAAAIVGSHTRIGASQAGLQSQQVGSWNAIATAVGSADTRMSASQRGLQVNQTASWNGIASAVVASHSRMNSSQAVLQGRQAASWNAIANSLVLADGRMNTSTIGTQQQMFSSWNAIAGSTQNSVTRQNTAFSSLQQGMTQVRGAMTQTAGWAETQYGRIRGAAERPIHDVLTMPFNQGIIAGWNSLDSQFHLGHHVNPVPVPFSAGGPVAGPGGPREDLVPALLSNGEFVVNAAATSANLPLLQSMNAQRFADGGLVGANIFGGMVDPAFNKVQPMLARILAQYPGNLAAIDGTDIAKQGVDGAKKALNDLLSQMMASFGVLRNGAVVSAAVKAEQAYALSQFARFGWGPDQLPALITLWNGESGWNPTIANSSSGAYGIPQALPASKMAAAGPDWRTNPATQINWGLSYIKATYGSPSAALAAWMGRNPHWYGDGVQGAVFDQPTLIGVGEKGRERVDVTPLRGGSTGDSGLADEIAAKLADLLARNRPLTFEVYGATQATVEDVVDEALFKARHVGKSVYS